MNRSRIVTILWSIALLAVLAAPASALNTYWQHDPAIPGSWHDPANWNNGIPTSSDSAYIDNGGTAVVTDSIFTADVYIGYDNSGYLQQNQGSGMYSSPLYLGYNEGATGYYALDGGELGGIVEYIGVSGNGTFTQRGGENYCNLYLGCNSGSTGIYNLIDGELVVGEAHIGYGGSGVFTQNGGIYTINGGWMEVGLGGTYILNDGDLKGTMGCGEVILGTFTQNGGNNEIDVMSGGGISVVGTYNFNGGGLLAAVEEIGGTFNQTSGGNLVVGMLRIWGVYNLAGGHADINGSLTVAGELNITSSTASLSVSLDPLTGYGNDLIFETGSKFCAVSGTTILMYGSNLCNLSVSEADLAGLEKTTFVFAEGVDTGVDTLEIAGLNMGDAIEGFVENFALTGLTVGDGWNTGYVQLVDITDNGNRGCVGGEAEALYVRNLVLTEGSTLDLNEYHLYCLTLDNQGGTFLNGTPIQIPEPSTLFLLAPALFGVAGMILKRSQKPEVRSQK